MANDALPGEMEFQTTAGTQQGTRLLLQLRDIVGEKGTDLSINCGRLGNILSGPPHPYYLLTNEGDFMVGDGGDWGDLGLPPEYRTRWPGELSQDHIEKLNSLIPGGLEVLDEVNEGAKVDYDLVVELRNEVVDHYDERYRFMVGEILTGVKYVNTRKGNEQVMSELKVIK